MILEGMTFNLRHLGMTLVDQPKGEDLSAAAVKRIVATVRAGTVHYLIVFLKCVEYSLKYFALSQNADLCSLSCRLWIMMLSWSILRYVS